MSLLSSVIGLIGEHRHVNAKSSGLVAAQAASLYVVFFKDGVYTVFLQTYSNRCPSIDEKPSELHSSVQLTDSFIHDGHASFQSSVLSGHVVFSHVEFFRTAMHFSKVSSNTQLLILQELYGPETSVRSCRLATSVTRSKIGENM